MTHGMFLKMKQPFTLPVYPKQRLIFNAINKLLLVAMISITFIVSSHLISQASNTLEVPQHAVAPHMLSSILGRDDDTGFFLRPVYE
jgi:hypothetical protein